MFAFGIRYLNGFVAASEPDDMESAEWPPHPGRVFMALAAAYFQTGSAPEERKALLWLESLEKDDRPAAPQLIAGFESRRKNVTQYVPINDRPGPSKALMQSVALTRERQPRTFARAWLDDDTVYMVWPDFDPDDSIRRALAALCLKVTRIGHSTSLVQMWLAEQDEPGEPSWVPDESRAKIHLRIAPRGTLEYLEQRYNEKAIEEYAELKVVAADTTDKKAQKAAKKRLKDVYLGESPTRLRPSLSVYQGYAPPPSARADMHAALTVFSPHMIILRFSRDQGAHHKLDLACTLQVASQWREALISQSNELSGSVRSILSGHDSHGAPLEEPHLAFVPLAFVGHEHADGHLLGMGITLPLDTSAEDRRGVLRALGRVRMLNLGSLGVWHLEPVIEARPAWSLQSEIWTAHTRGATHWSTVTPIVFDRHPKTDDKSAYREEVAKMIGRCCTRIGLPEPQHVVVTAVSTHIGTPPSHAFPRLHRKDGSQRRHTHAIIVFGEPVCGPILLGAGRYRGYGLCRPIEVAHGKGVER